MEGIILKSIELQKRMTIYGILSTKSFLLPFLIPLVLNM